MSTTEIREKLHGYIDSSDDDIVTAVFAFFKSYNGLNNDVVDKEEYNRDIEEAMADIALGEFDAHEEVVAIIKKRYEKNNLV
jgi:hypothetical protein